ncbi:response regulator [Caldimonas tepidiphila]|uniref:response regulator n=1 Tax=Caldimonas tepidiphila TaxID=2315841 RepID=UPI0013003312|nr:response regulator [Caldimonas tepidiphila]
MPDHLLVVDDNPDVTGLFQLYFESLGYRVSTAAEGGAALRIDDADPADLVITDLSMPGMGGWDLSMHLHERRPGLPVIVVSGYPANEAFPQRRLCVLAKPVSLAVLEQRVGEMLCDAREEKSTTSTPPVAE